MKTIIEAGHFYSVNGPSAASLKGWQLGKELATSLPHADLALFIDDYHDQQAFLVPGDSFLGSEEASVAAQTMLLEADHVFSEAEIAAMAGAKALELLNTSEVKLKRNKVSTLTGGIVLGSLVDGDISSFSPRCVFLDWMLLAEKADLGEEQVIVLPATYQKEQAQLKVVLDQLPVPKMTGGLKSVFYNLDSSDLTLHAEAYI
jgi:hypothetical protein